MREDYKILESSNPRELEKKVLEFLSDGYQLIGGHQVTTVSYRTYTSGENVLREIAPYKWNITQAVYRPEQEREVIKKKKMI